MLCSWKSASSPAAAARRATAKLDFSDDYLGDDHLGDDHLVDHLVDDYLCDHVVDDHLRDHVVDDHLVVDGDDLDYHDDATMISTRCCDIQVNRR